MDNDKGFLLGTKSHTNQRGFSDTINDQVTFNKHPLLDIKKTIRERC